MTVAMDLQSSCPICAGMDGVYNPAGIMDMCRVHGWLPGWRTEATAGALRPRQLELRLR